VQHQSLRNSVGQNTRIRLILTLLCSDLYCWYPNAFFLVPFPTFTDLYTEKNNPEDMKGPLSTLALAIILLSFTAEAYPGYLVNSCDRNLEIGHEIMGFPVVSSDDAPDDQQHSVILTSASSSGQSICGGSFEQGTELTIVVDESLATAADGGGPNYIVEAQNSFLELRDDPSEERGCGNTRIVNPGATIKVQPLAAGEMVVRMLYAYSYGQVYASDECTVSVTGDKVLAQGTGYLVDNANWNSETYQASSHPSTLTVGQLLEGSDSGYSIIEYMADQEEFLVKFGIDSSQTGLVVSLLESLSADMTNVQVSYTGFEASDGGSFELISITDCSDASTCGGFQEPPTDGEGGGEEEEEDDEVDPDQVCIGGICIESSTVDDAENTITVTIVSDDDSWLGFGFTTPGGGMNGGGSGSDIFTCSSAGLERFLTTTKVNPASGSTSSELLQVSSNLCEVDEDTGRRRMTFTRTLDGFRPIVAGTDQSIIYARGPAGEQSLSSKHPNDRRGEVLIDLTSLENGLSAATKRSAPCILWAHIVCMSLAWGLFLPLAVIIANRCRGPAGSKSSSWFWWHKIFARLGWTLQLLGAICAVYYAEVYSSHLESRHAKFGLFIIVAGFLQPISALFRPHPPPEGWEAGTKPFGRTLFEIYHKGIGWTAIASGMINVFLGARLVKSLDFESIVRIIPMSIGSIGTGIFALFGVMSLISPNNPLTSKISGGDGSHFVKNRYEEEEQARKPIKDMS